MDPIGVLGEWLLVGRFGEEWGFVTIELTSGESSGTTTQISPSGFFLVTDAGIFLTEQVE